MEGLYLPKLEDLCICCVSDLFQFEPLILPSLKRLSLGPKKNTERKSFWMDIKDVDKMCCNLYFGYQSKI